MEMTTPVGIMTLSLSMLPVDHCACAAQLVKGITHVQVLTTAGQSGPGSNRMAFVMESDYDLASLPVPRDSRIERRQIEAGKVFAVWSFSGLPLDFEVIALGVFARCLCHSQVIFVFVSLLH